MQIWYNLQSEDAILTFSYPTCVQFNQPKGLAILQERAHLPVSGPTVHGTPGTEADGNGPLKLLL